MIIQEKICGALMEGFQALFGTVIDHPALQPTRKEFKGEYTFVVFPYLKLSKKNPEETGSALGTYLVQHAEYVKDVNIVKGFLNIEIKDKAWLEQFNAMGNASLFGAAKTKGAERLVEFSSPNTNKPLHLGHLRNNFLGFSVANILEANGDKVYKVQIINDRGIHICKSMVAWQKFGNGETPVLTGWKGDKLVGKYYVLFDKYYKEEVARLIEQGFDKEKAEKESPLMMEAQEMLRKWEMQDTEVLLLWDKLNGWVYEGFEQTYRTMGVSFEKLYYESETYKLGKKEVLKGVENGIFYKKEDGSVWVDLTDTGLDQKLLLRSDGTSVYMTQDIGTAIQRFKDFPDIAGQVYTVGNEQDYHFKVLFIILKKLGFQWADQCYHLSYGMVDLPSGKMKSREGTVVDADDLMQEMFDAAESHTKELGKIEGLSEQEAGELYHTLGLGALKYFLLKVDPKKRMLFDPSVSIQFQGNTGPFIQYSHARICSILRRADDLGIAYNKKINEALSLSEIERNGLYLLSEYKNKVQEAARDYSPAIIAQFVYDLAKEYNRFYAELPIFNENDQWMVQFRVAYSYQVANVIKHCMGLLGIVVPDRM